MVEKWKSIRNLIAGNLVGMGLVLLMDPGARTSPGVTAWYLGCNLIGSLGGFWLGRLQNRAGTLDRIDDMIERLPTAIDDDTCPYDPRTCPGQVGMHHCPECGNMVIAGMAHPDYDAHDEHLLRMTRLDVGDLVITHDGYYALVARPPDLDARSTGMVSLAIGNGTEQEIDWSSIREVCTLPGSTAHANFKEWFHQRP